MVWEKPKMSESEIAQMERDHYKALVTKALRECIHLESKKEDLGDIGEEFFFRCIAKDFGFDLNSPIDLYLNESNIGDDDNAKFVFDYLVDLCTAIKSVREKHKKVFAWNKKIEEMML